MTHLVRAGDHIICMDDVYGGTRRYFSRIAARHGLEFTYSDFSKAGELEAAISPKTKVCLALHIGGGIWFTYLLAAGVVGVPN